MTEMTKTQKATAAMVANFAARRERDKDFVIETLRLAGRSLTLAEIKTETGFNRTRTYQTVMELHDEGRCKPCGPYHVRRWYAVGHADPTLISSAASDQEIEDQILAIIKPGSAHKSQEIYESVTSPSKARIKAALRRLCGRKAIYCTRIASGGFHYSDMPLETASKPADRPYRIREIRTETGARRVQFGDHYKLVSSRPNPSRPALGASPLEWGR
jgi:hypothetical protein